MVENKSLLDKSKEELIKIVECGQAIIPVLMDRSQALQSNTERRSYSTWFKDLLISQQESGYTYPQLSYMTGISLDALKKFKKNAHNDLIKKDLSDKDKEVLRMWNEASPYFRKTLGRFRIFLDKKYPEFSISRLDLRQTLINLGLKYPRGPQIADHGARVKKQYSPHALWEGDGKTMEIIVNGKKVNFCWYAFCDQQITLLVGFNIDKTETAENFIAALEQGKKKVGFYPIGVLIDNRLTGGEINHVMEYCQERGITVVKTFPGNSKSTGNIENNFSVYEKFVGKIVINGRTDEEIAQSISQTIIEIFTQMRDHSPRKRLRGLTPAEAGEGAVRPEHARDEIELMSNRLQPEKRGVSEKWEIIASIRQDFGELDEKSQEKLRRELGKYPIDDIIAAKSRYSAQRIKEPLNKYGPEYFLGILRHKRESKAKKKYNEAYRAGLELKAQLFPSTPGSTFEIASDIMGVLTGLKDLPSPSHQMLLLDSLCWWMVRNSAIYSIPELWREITDLSEISFGVSLRLWTKINEYVHDRLGDFLYKHSPQPVPPPEELDQKAA